MFIIMMMVYGLMSAFAQDSIVLYIANYPQDMDLCLDNHETVVIYARENCNDFWWHGQGFSESWTSPLIINWQLGLNFRIFYDDSCNDGFSHDFRIHYRESEAPNACTRTEWKRQAEEYTLEAIDIDSIPYWYNYLWSTGETTRTINVVEPGTYTCEISDLCSSSIRTFIVKDNVEIYRATTDLRNNLNQVTWEVNVAQAEYISQVKVYRNTYQLVATLPYTDGIFTDDIGSESTQWQYHVVGVDTNGNDCPIPSYWKRTIHLDHVQGTGGGEILQWTPYEEENPSKDVVVAYAIYDVVNGEPNHVMDVGNFTNVYAYNPNDFDGYGTVAAVFEGKGRDMEDLAFSNLTAEVLDVGEVSSTNFSVYPNPTNGTFTVEGAKTLTIYNTMGQVVARSDNDEGKHTLSLAPGVYFVKSDEGSVQKVVVE